MSEQYPWAPKGIDVWALLREDGYPMYDAILERDIPLGEKIERIEAKRQENLTRQDAYWQHMQSRQDWERETALMKARRGIVVDLDTLSEDLKEQLEASKYKTIGDQQSRAEQKRLMKYFNEQSKTPIPIYGGE